MESMNPYQTPSADVSAVPGQGDYDESNPFSPSGRFGRLSYVAWNMALMIPIMIVMFGVIGISALQKGGGFSPALILIEFIAMFPMIMFTIRRLHDFDSSGWWALMLIVPLANVILYLLLWFKPGTQGANRFAPPRATRGWEKVLGYIAIGFGILYIVGIIAAIAIPALVRH